MIVPDTEPEYYAIVQQQADKHRYFVAGGRIFSHLSEARRVYDSAVAAFDAQVAAGVQVFSWRPELVSVLVTSTDT